MQVVVAKTAGFCFGVKRAVDMVYEQVETGKTVHTYGPIVHNEEVVKDLEEKGVKVIGNRQDLLAMDRESIQPREGTVIIRAHGVPKEIYDLMEEKQLERIDATCPFVKHIHRIVQKRSEEGRQIIVIGNETHPEVEGIKGWSKTPVTVVETQEQAQNFSANEGQKLCIVAQTTFNYKKFQDLVEIFQKKGYDIIVANTICNATKERQEEALELAAKADVMIVIGGTHSSNTRILTRNEYTNEPNVDLTAVIKAGDKMEVKVLKVNDGEGQVLLTYKRLAADRGNKRIEEAFNSKEVLTAKVSQVLDGGLSVVVEEVRIFIPASLVSDVYEKDLNKYAGQEIEFVISEYNPKRRRYIGDRKQLIVAKKAEMQKELFAKIKPGDVIEGTVKNVTDFGAFIDLGGVDGLLHISEMSWGRVENPKKVFKVGEVLKVLIKDIDGTKVALSLKFDDSNPWKNASTKYAVGNEVTGKVARMTDFGAFVELEPGIDALLHVSQIAKEHIEKPADVLSVGQEVTAKVVDFNEEGKKISLSIKALLAPEVKEEPAQETVSEDDADVVSVDIDAVIAKQEAEETAE